MSQDIADKTIDFIFRSPSLTIKLECQGGESLLNFDMVKYLVVNTKERNRQENRDIEFVLATNLSALTDDMLDFMVEHDIIVSTSLDGPRELHNVNRPRSGHDSHDDVIRGIKRVRERLGPHAVAALMTTTRRSLSQPREIVDEYVRNGFSSIFLRTLNPYGLAAKPDYAEQYSIEEWLEFYKEALSHIIKINCQGVNFREEYSSILLRKILTPYPTGFVDLQSPAGIGISGIVINYDGYVYASDESRMLAEMKDYSFRLGDVCKDSYEDIMLSDKLLDVLNDTMTEGMPMCADCGVQPYCGSDPVRHYRLQGDIVGFKPASEFCKRNMEVIKHLIRLLEDNPRAASILRTWAN